MLIQRAVYLTKEEYQKIVDRAKQDRMKFSPFVVKTLLDKIESEKKVGE